MKSKIGIVQPTSFPDGLGVGNSGIGTNQLPIEHTRVSSPNATMAHVGTAFVAGVPGQFPQNTRMSIQDGFGKKIEIKRD